MDEINKKIRHTGIISAIDGDRLQVRILQVAACASCKAARLCNASEKKVKTVDVYDHVTAQSHSVGDEVTVCTSLRTGYKAVALGFVVPLVVLLTAMVVSIYYCGSDDAVASLIGVGAVALYYIVLSFFREQIRGRFSFHIENF